VNRTAAFAGAEDLVAVAFFRVVTSFADAALFLLTIAFVGFRVDDRVEVLVWDNFTVNALLWGVNCGRGVLLPVKVVPRLGNCVGLSLESNGFRSSLLWTGPLPRNSAAEPGTPWLSGGLTVASRCGRDATMVSRMSSDDAISVVLADEIADLACKRYAINNGGDGQTSTSSTLDLVACEGGEHVAAY